jgi:prepilin-type N-terminal cleavage/methylation domain-containing protein
MHSTQNSEFRIQNLSNKAFTLLELILVIVITAILSVVVIPNVFSGYSTVRTSTAIRKIADDIRYCREEAIATRKRCRIQFNTGNNSYTVYLDGTVMPHPVNQGNFVVDLGSDITLTSVSFTGDSLSFNKFGNPAEGGTITLNGSRYITVESETGTLDIQ